jgi:hypothetical protein
VRNIEPQIKQQSSLEQEVFRMSRNSQTIQQALNGVASEDKVEILFFRTSLGEQPSPHGSANIPFVHARLSR